MAMSGVRAGDGPEASYPSLDLSGKLIIKMQLGEDIRRIPIHNEDITYDELILMMQRVFRGHLETKDELTIKYKDEDDDLITISDSSELSFAIQCSRILRLVLFVNGLPRGLQGDELKHIRKELKDIRNRVNTLLDSLEPQSLTALDTGDLATDVDMVSSPPTMKSTGAASASGGKEFDPLSAPAKPEVEPIQNKVMNAFGISNDAGIASVPRPASPADSLSSVGSSASNRPGQQAPGQPPQQHQQHFSQQPGYPGFPPQQPPAQPAKPATSQAGYPAAQQLQQQAPWNAGPGQPGDASQAQYGAGQYGAPQQANQQPPGMAPPQTQPGGMPAPASQQAAMPGQQYAGQPTQSQQQPYMQGYQQQQPQYAGQPGAPGQPAVGPPAQPPAHHQQYAGFTGQPGQQATQPAMPGHNAAAAGAPGNPYAGGRSYGQYPRAQGQYPANSQYQQPQQ